MTSDVDVMQAAYIDEVGGAEQIQVGELPVPTRGPTDALVAVEVCSVNAVDAYIRSGSWVTPMPFPFVVGRDLVGTVVDVDPVSGFAPGDSVWCNSLGHGGRQGACAEYAVVPTDRMYPLPDGVDPVQAVATFHPAATAFIGLRHRARVRAGDTVVIGGGAGAVGSCAIRFAAAEGARVLATARPEDHELCREAGAAVTLDFQASDLYDQVQAAAPDGVDLFWDTSGHAALHDVMPCVAPGGVVMVTAGREAQPPTPLWPLYTRDVSVVGFVISRASSTELAEAAQAINAALDRGQLGVRVAEVLPFEDIRRAHRLVDEGTSGRIVIAIDPGVAAID